MDQFGFVETLEARGRAPRARGRGEQGLSRSVLAAAAGARRACAQAPERDPPAVHRRGPQGRGARLKESPELFSGLLWSGARSIELGLSDGYGTVDYVAREVIKAEQIVEYTRKENLLDRLAKRFGAAVTESIALGGAGAVRLR